MELDNTLDKFISSVGKSKVAVVVPLYGYWKDIEDNPLNLETLRMSVDRLKSSLHSLYIIFVAETSKIPKDIQNYIITEHKTAGNFLGVEVVKGASYAEYVRKGLEVAEDTTEASYFIVFNPWNLIQKIGIDMLVDRLNYGDEAKIVSGFNLRGEITSDNFNPLEFERISYNIPEERYKVDSNFMGITRSFLETIPLDKNIKTAAYLEFDLFQNMKQKGFATVASQRLPMFVFDVNISYLENPIDMEMDRDYFSKKWGYIPTE